MFHWSVLRSHSKENGSWKILQCSSWNKNTGGSGRSRCKFTWKCTYSPLDRLNWLWLKFVIRLPTHSSSVLENNIYSFRKRLPWEDMFMLSGMSSPHYFTSGDRRTQVWSRWALVFISTACLFSSCIETVYLLFGRFCHHFIVGAIALFIFCTRGMSHGDRELCAHWHDCCFGVYFDQLLCMLFSNTPLSCLYSYTVQ